MRISSSASAIPPSAFLVSIFSRLIKTNIHPYTSITSFIHTPSSITMKLLLIVVGKTADRRLESLIADYTSRLSHYIPFSIEVIPELRNAKSLSFEQQKEREGELILRCLAEGDWLVLLDEGGQEFRSVEFARYIDRRCASGAKRLVFVVGGPYGFSPAVYERCREKISLSRLTFSHQMVRLFFVEQLYRAMTILRGEPYHHE